MRSAALLATRSIRARHVSVRSFSGLAQIDPSRLDIRKTGTRKLFPAKEDLVFGQLFADHMLEVDWTAEHGWHAPVIKPYGPFAMDPASSSLHYGLQCFEGMKAYVDADDNIRLFRPDMNMARLKVSSGRMNLPDFDGDAFLECIKELDTYILEEKPPSGGYLLASPKGGENSKRFRTTAYSNQSQAYQKAYTRTYPLAPKEQVRTYGAHSCRKSMASWLWDDDWDKRVIADQGGWALQRDAVDLYFKTAPHTIIAAVRNIGVSLRALR